MVMYFIIPADYGPYYGLMRNVVCVKIKYPFKHCLEINKLKFGISLFIITKYLRLGKISKQNVS